jgi:hypothetical protein
MPVGLDQVSSLARRHTVYLNCRHEYTVRVVRATCDHKHPLICSHQWVGPLECELDLNIEMVVKLLLILSGGPETQSLHLLDGNDANFLRVGDIRRQTIKQAANNEYVLEVSSDTEMLLAMLRVVDISAADKASVVNCVNHSHCLLNIEN